MSLQVSSAQIQSPTMREERRSYARFQSAFIRGRQARELDTIRGIDEYLVQLEERTEDLQHDIAEMKGTLERLDTDVPAHEETIKRALEEQLDVSAELRGGITNAIIMISHLKYISEHRHARVDRYAHLVSHASAMMLHYTEQFMRYTNVSNTSGVHHGDIMVQAMRGREQSARGIERVSALYEQAVRDAQRASYDVSNAENALQRLRDRKKNVDMQLDTAKARLYESQHATAEYRAEKRAAIEASMYESERMVTLLIELTCSLEIQVCDLYEKVRAYDKILGYNSKLLFKQTLVACAA